MNSRFGPRHYFDLLRFVVIQVTCAAVAFLAGIYDLVLLNTSIDRLQGNDFGKFFYGFHAWRAGWSLYSPTSATHMQVEKEYLDFLNLNPPHFHLLLLPIARLPLRAAAYVWMASNLCAGLLAVWIICRELGIRPTPRMIVPSLAMVLACGATGAVLITGQFTGLMLLPLTLAWRALRRGEEWTCGGWLGLLISVKPFLALFVPALAWRREWRAVVAAGTSVLVWFAIGLSVFGMGEHLAWLRALREIRWEWGAMNGSWQALLVRAFTSTPYAQPTYDAPSLVQPFWLVGSLVIFVVTIIASRRSVDHAFAAVTLAALLISPLGWVYYLWLALPGMVALSQERVPRPAAIALVALLVPYFGPTFAKLGPLFTLTVGCVYTWVTLMLWYTAVAQQKIISDYET
jgi:hypothetical protein